VGFLGGSTQKNPPGFFGYVPGCLNPAVAQPSASKVVALVYLLFYSLWRGL